MFDVGFAELFLLSIIGLLVLGPERLPAVARTLGGFVRKARASWYSLKRTIDNEMAIADVKEPIRAAQDHLEAMQRKMNEPLAAVTGETKPRADDGKSSDTEATSTKEPSPKTSDQS